MPRAATTADVFNAIAEPRRRLIIEALARAGATADEETGAGGDGGCAVQTLVALLRLPQPTVSKHLAVLLAVGLVAVHRRGRQRVYRLNAAELRPVHEWTGRFERFWSEQLSRIKQRAERRAKSATLHPWLARAQRTKHTQRNQRKDQSP